MRVGTVRERKDGEYRVGQIRFFVSRGVGTSRIDLRFFAAGHAVACHFPGVASRRAVSTA